MAKKPKPKTTPVRVPKCPKYRRHASGQAFVRIGKKNVYLGKYGTPESRLKYAEVIAQIMAGETDPVVPAKPTAALTVTEALTAYDAFASAYYQKDGTPTRQLERVRRACGIVRDLCGDRRAIDFGPQALEAVRQEMVRLDWTRGHVNSCVGCVKRAFRWMVSRELIPPTVYSALAALEGLRRGRTTAREGKRVLPAPEASIEGARSMLRPILAAMVQTQLLTGMRPGEVCLLRLSRIDRSKPVWIYRPERYKMEHAGRMPLILIGPRAQAIILEHALWRCPLCRVEDRPRWLARRNGVCGPCADRIEGGEVTVGNLAPVEPESDSYVFDPSETLRDWHAELRDRRRSKVQPSQVNRKKGRLERKPGEHYTSNTYNQAVRRACRAAEVEPFHVHQLRHNAAGRLREQFGWDVTRLILGHASVSTTQIYVEELLQPAIDAIFEVG